MVRMKISSDFLVWETCGNALGDRKMVYFRYFRLEGTAIIGLNQGTFHILMQTQTFDQRQGMVYT